MQKIRFLTKLNSFNNFIRAAPKAYDEEEIKEIVESFENMDEEEYENAPAELKTIYITYGLEQRRKKHLEKMVQQLVAFYFWFV